MNLVRITAIDTNRGCLSTVHDLDDAKDAAYFKELLDETISGGATWKIIVEWEDAYLLPPPDELPEEMRSGGRRFTPVY
jgi:hypothetical protein